MRLPQEYRYRYSGGGMKIATGTMRLFQARSALLRVWHGHAIIWHVSCSSTPKIVGNPMPLVHHHEEHKVGAQCCAAFITALQLPKFAASLTSPSSRKWMMLNRAISDISWPCSKTPTKKKNSLERTDQLGQIRGQSAFNFRLTRNIREKIRKEKEKQKKTTGQLRHPSQTKPLNPPVFLAAFSSFLLQLVSHCSHRYMVLVGLAQAVSTSIYLRLVQVHVL